MNKWSWWNPFLPQTLLISVALAYIGFAFTVILQGILVFSDPFVLLPTALSVLGAFGIVNLRWWGYILSLISSLLPFGLVILAILFSDLTLAAYLRVAVFGPGLISTIFQIALVALLVHPMSWSFVKSNFSKKLI